jgi:formylglycine-generating enzyme required for sulfatase activity
MERKVIKEGLLMKKLIVVLFLLIAAGVYAQRNSVPYPDNMVRINGGTFTMGSPAALRYSAPPARWAHSLGFSLVRP